MHPRSHIARKVNGFTLIELMIVMAIVAMLMGLVGPLATNSLEKAKVNEERMYLRYLIKVTSDKAQISNYEYEIRFSGKKAELIRIDDAEKSILVKNIVFESLFFKDSLLTFNSNGYVSPIVLTALNKEKEYTIELGRFINGYSN